MTKPICESSALLDGGEGVRFSISLEGEEVPAFVVRYDGQVSAYLNRCGHIPVELDWMPGQFFDSEGLYLVCATHGAAYAPDTGACAGGPCNGRGLQPVAVDEHDGYVFLKADPKILNLKAD